MKTGTLIGYVVCAVIGVAFVRSCNKNLLKDYSHPRAVKREGNGLSSNNLESDAEARLVVKLIKDAGKYAETHTRDEFDKFFQNTLNKSSIGEVNRTRLRVAWERLKQDNGDEIERIHQFQQDIQDCIAETLKGYF